MKNRFECMSGFRKGLLGTLALAAAVSLTAVAAGAELRLKSGLTWRGELNDIVQVVYMEGSREVQLEGKLLRADTTLVVVESTSGGKTSKKSIFFGDVKSLKSVTAAATTDKPADATSTAPTADKGETKAADGAKAVDAAGTAAAPVAAGDFKGVFFLPLEGMVGTGMRAAEIEAIGKEADKYGPGQIIVLEIDSPGGLVVEAAERIHVTMSDLKKRHRVVAWIKKAISAAAFTALHCEEIYFMKIGSLGSMTMFSGKENVAKGESLAAWLELAGEVAKEGGRDPHMAKCMIVKDLVCSYDIPEGGGPKDARFRPDTKGQFLLDGDDTMLSFTAETALACGFSDGTADSTAELAKLMGLREWKEFNDSGRKIYRDWQSLLERGTNEMATLWVQFQYKGDSDPDPIATLGVKIRIVKDLIRWHEKCWSCALAATFEKGVGIPPKEYLEQLLKELEKALSDLRRAEKERDRAAR
jgi:hypothetical protein